MPNVSSGDQLQTLAGHSNYVNCVAYSPDGAMLASGSSDHTVKLWNASSGELLATCMGHSNAVRSVAFSPDGRYFASAGEDRLVRLWDAQTHQIVLTITNHAPYALAFSDRYLALATSGDFWGYDGGVVQIWNYTNGQMVAELPESGNRAAFSPDGKILATANWRGWVKLWNLDDLKPFKSFHSQEVLSLAFSRDGLTLAWGTGLGDIGLWELNQDRPTIHHKSNFRVYAVALSPDGRHLASAHQTHDITLWDIQSGQIIQRLLGHGDQVLAVAFSADGTLAYGSFDDKVMLWTPFIAKEQTVISNIKTPRWDRVGLPVFSPDGKRFAAATVNGFVRLWDIATGQADRGTNMDGLPVAFSADGRSLFTRNGSFKLLRRWDVSTQSLIESTAVMTPNDGNYDSAVSPDGKLVATSHNGRIVLNDLITGQLVCALPQTSIARCVSFSADSAKLLAGNWDGVARLWDVKTRQLVWTSPGFRNTVGAVAFSANGVFAAGSWDGTIKIWDANADKVLATLTGHKAGVIQLAFSSDGRTLASGSDDSTVKLWNLAIGCEVITFKTDVPQYYVTFSPDDKILATGGGDGKVHFWHAASLAEIAQTEKADTEQ